MIHSILLQIMPAGDSAAAAVQSAGTPAPAPSMSLWELALKGGPVMIPIAILSVIAVYLVVERYIAIRRSSQENPNFMSSIRDSIHSGNLEAARALCKNTQSPIARMIEKGITRFGKPLEDVEKAIQNVGNIEIVKLEKGLSVLATVASAAPMLGFLGTVTGMIQAFYQMSQAGKQIEIGLLSGGMYQAMVTTVAGLIVGIFALVTYNTLVGMVQKIVFKMENSSIDFMDLLHETRQA